MNPEDMGKRLELERERLNLKAVDVYNQLGVHQNTYKNYETGKRDMPSSLAVKLWNIGFDVMYVLLGVRLETLASDAIANDIDTPTRYARRLIYLPEVMDVENPSDALLVAMYHAEEAFIQAGAEANNDYDYKTLANIGLGLINRVK